jgi:hypothetical protein
MAKSALHSGQQSHSQFVRRRHSLYGLIIALSCVPSAGCRAARSTPGVPLDAEGVVELLPDAAEPWSFQLGKSDPNHLPGVVIEKARPAAQSSEWGLEFWRIEAYELDYSSGHKGKTARVHLFPHGGTQRFDFQTQKGYLSSERDPKDQEFTAYVRVNGVFEPRRAAVSLKIRGGAHTKKNPALASCTMMTIATRDAPAVARFGKELNHPHYDYVALDPKSPAALRDGKWLGLKLVSFTDPAQRGRVINRLYVDEEPFASDGTPANRFELFSEYIDVEGVSTGFYDKLVDWGGYQTTLRVDGVESVDIAILSLRAVRPSG